MSPIATVLSRSNQKIYYSSLVLVVAIKTIPLRDELSPFQFCDETIWINEVSRMIQSGSLIPQEFRSGSTSILPVFLAAKLLTTIFQHDLTSDELTLLARALLIVGGAAMTFLIFGRVLQKLKIASWLIAPACTLLLLNPSQLAFSRYWYPDHFIILPSTIFLLTCVNVISSKQKSSRHFFYVGLAFALLVSTKYTTITASVCFFPLVMAHINTTSRFSQVKVAIRRLLTISVSAIALFSLLNYGIFFHYIKFTRDFRFNLQNYSQLPGGLNSLLFYTWMLIVAPFGLLGFPLIALGVRGVWKKSLSLLLAVVPFLVFLLIGLARSGVTISRNIAVGLPFVTLFLVVGINQWISNSRNRSQSSISMHLVFPLLLLLPVAGESLISIRSDLRADSRDQAVIWINKNIPMDTNIGNNEFCSGISPGDVAGIKTTNDPTFSLQLDYYLINSYWDSPLSPYYQSNLNQRFFHFYRLKNGSIPIDFQRLRRQDYVPEGYEIVKVIDGDGPEILILKKRL
jgi:hypothetical protein